jgi:hypothetical protein
VRKFHYELLGYLSDSTEDLRRHHHAANHIGADNSGGGRHHGGTKNGTADPDDCDSDEAFSIHIQDGVRH